MVAVLTPVSQGARAQTVPGQPRQIGWSEAAQALMNQGRFDDAEGLISARLAIAPKDVEAHFLRGMIEVAKGKHRLAIQSFRAILVDNPDAVRVRLELARAFFLDRDYGNAQRQFRFALAGDLPPPVIANINAYLSAIREAKDLTYSLSVAVTPDSNLNTGSTAREVSLFGLPFDLSDDARERSGVGIAVDMAGEWAPRVAPRLRLRAGLGVQRRDYRKSDFDDMTLAVYGGPRRGWKRTDVSLLATASQRWYGGSRYNRAIGGRIEAALDVTARLSISAAVSAASVRYRHSPLMDGTLSSLGGGLAYALTPATAVTLRGGLARQSARIEGYSSLAGFVGVGYHRELPKGFTISVEPSWSNARYDAPLPAFGEKRSDDTRTLLMTVLNRRIVLSRFTPRISFTAVRQSSSIPLYSFKKNRLEVGLTSQF